MCKFIWAHENKILMSNHIKLKDYFRQNYQYYFNIYQSINNKFI